SGVPEDERRWEVMPTPHAQPLYVAPLCPAGHLPHEGGDRPAARVSPIASSAGKADRSKLPISPLVGEMSGRTEGGAKERDLSSRCLTSPHHMRHRIPLHDEELAAGRVQPHFACRAAW